LKLNPSIERTCPGRPVMPLISNVKGHQMRSAAIMVMLAAFPLFAAASKCIGMVDVHFSPRLSTVSASEKEIVIHAIERLERRSKILQVIAIGHADLSDALPEDRAEKLSMRRVREVRNFVVSVRPELAPQTYVEAKGTQLPVAGPGDERNRRVELELICPGNWSPTPSR
jgi:hypothetical protein